MITFLLVQCNRPGKYLIPTSQVRKLKHRGTYGLRKAVPLAFNPSSHSGQGGGRRVKTVAAFKYSEFIPWEREQSEASHPRPFGCCLGNYLLRFSTPFSPLPYPITLVPAGCTPYQRKNVAQPITASLH